MPENNNLDFENITNEVSGEENSPDTEELKEERKDVEAENTVRQQNFAQTEIKHTYVTYIPYGLTPETYEERKSIKKIARAVGGSLLALNAIILIINILLVVAVQFLSFSNPEVIKLIQEPVFLHTQQILLSLLVFTVPFIAIFKLMGYRISNLIEFEKPEKGLFLPFFLFGVGFCAFANIASSYASAFFRSFGIEYNVDFGENPKGVFGFLLAVISTVIVPAFVEEFACRGLILGSLRKFGDGFAVMVSSIIFGVMHGNFEQIPFAFLVGLILGYVTVKSGSIWIAISIHAFNNGISIIFDYFLGDIPTMMQNIIYSVFLCVSLLLGIVSFKLLKNKDGIYSFENDKNKTASTEKQKYKWFFTSVMIIIFIVFCFLESLSFFILK